MGDIPHTIVCSSQAILLTGYKQEFCATPFMLYTVQRCYDPGCDCSHSTSKTVPALPTTIRGTSDFLRRLLEGNVSSTPPSPLSSSSPSILEPRAGNFTEPFNSCKDPVQGADQSRLGAKICSQKANELSKHSIQ